MDRRPDDASRALVVLAVLAVIAALSLLKTILIPVAVALVLTCMLSPLARFCAGIFRTGRWVRCAPVPAVGGRRPLPGELDGREPGRGDLHACRRTSSASPAR